MLAIFHIGVVISINVKYIKLKISCLPSFSVKTLINKRERERVCFKMQKLLFDLDLENERGKKIIAHKYF